jgi:hypothetical protein
MSSSSVLPLLLVAGTAVGISMFVNHKTATATEAAPAPAVKGLVRRNSDLAWASEEGALIRRRTVGEGHAGTGTMGADADEIKPRRNSGGDATSIK